MNVKKNGMLKTIMIIAVIAILGVVAWKTGFLKFITNMEALQTYFEELGYLGYIIYIFLFVLVAVFMIPASAITIVAGLTFGPILGGILALLGSTIGAIVAFLIAKYLARDKILSKFEGNAIFSKIEKGVEENGTSFLILTRLVPIFPYNVQNYAYGVTSIKTPVYSLVTFICMAPGAFIYAYLAGDIAVNGMSVNTLIKIAGAGIILFVVSLIPKAIAKKKGINLKD